MTSGSKDKEAHIWLQCRTANSGNTQ